MTTSSLPSEKYTNSDQFVKEFFDRYYTKSLEFPANEVDAVVAFFEKRGFEEVSANSVATVLLQQAKIDGVKVFTLLDTLTGLEDVRLSSLVTEILNYSRTKTSTLGFRVEQTTNLVESRNIAV
jgi:hypothetical protein